MRSQESKECRIAQREFRQPGTYSGARPPGWVALVPGRELIAIELRANVAGWKVGKRIVGQQAKCAAVIVQQLPNEVKSPGVLVGASHRGKPDLPVQAIVVRADHAGSPERIAGFALELVSLPLAFRSDHLIVGAFKNNLVSLLPTLPKAP